MKSFEPQVRRMAEREEGIKAAIAHLETLRASGVDYLAVSKPDANIAAQENVHPKSETAVPQNRKGALLELQETVRRCTRCSELAPTRTQTVFGAGYASARIVFVGEAPGFDEDRQGLPFVGKAGQLLTKMIEAMGLTRQQVFICNVLKCRPPQNRNPKPEEVMNCSPYLRTQLEIIKPAAICALGNFAAQTLLKTTQPISRLRGIVHNMDGIQLVCTFHPAYLLRNPADKRKAWEDLKMLLKATVPSETS